MRNSPWLMLLAVLTLLPEVCSNAQVQKEHGSLPASRQGFLSLDRANNGESVDATVGERIELTLGAVGGPSYGDPQISSPAIRLDATALYISPDGMINPGGGASIYMLEAVTQGEAQVKVPLNGAFDPETGRRHTLSTFSFTIRVGPAPGNSRQQGTSLLLDQVNSAPWNNASVSMDFVNGPGIRPKSAIRVLSQTFVPRLPRLTAIEVELTAAKSGQSTGDVAMTLMNKYQFLAQMWKTVPVADCDHVLFLLPNGGVTVVPGRAYRIQLTGIDGVLGWKYVAGGYAKGNASSEGKPLSQDGRSTFLFRTFGTKRHAQ
jgi:hypothetical protein